MSNDVWKLNGRMSGGCAFLPGGVAVSMEKITVRLRWSSGADDARYGFHRPVLRGRFKSGACSGDGLQPVANRARKQRPFAGDRGPHFYRED